MGAWSFMLRHFRDQNIQVISPIPSGSPAPGSHKKFEIVQNDIINRVFSTNDAPSKQPLTA